MGFLDSVLPRYKPSLVPIEGVRGVWTAARTMFGGFSVAGGQAIVTRQHLVFTPWDMDRTREWLFKLLSYAGAPEIVGKIDDLISASKLLEPVAIPLTDITSVDVLNRASLLKLPTARLHISDGSSFELGILASPRALTMSPANNEAFDDWIRHMRQPS
jgi:hypothetical protein